jgi:hypothetical protein
MPRDQLEASTSGEDRGTGADRYRCDQAIGQSTRSFTRMPAALVDGRGILPIRGVVY